MNLKLLFAGLIYTGITLTVTGQQSLYFKQDDIDFKRGIEYFEREKYSTAQQYFETAYNRTKDSNTETEELSQYYMALCAMRLFNEDSEYLVFKFVSEHPESPLVNDAYFNLSGYYYSRKKWGEAIIYYNKTNPDQLSDEDQAEYYFKLGYAYFSKEKYAEAKPAFFMIKDIDTKFTAPAVYYYSHIHYEEKNYQTALDGFLRLTKDKTFGPITPYYIVQIYFLQGRYQELVDFAPAMMKTITEKRLAEVSRITAEAYAHLNRYEESLPYFQTFLDSATIITKEDKYQAGYAFYKAGKYDNAENLFASIASTENQLGQNASYYLADCYLKKGDKAKARQAFQSASKLDFDPIIKQDALFNYALLSYELGNDPFNEAIRSFEEFVRLYPESKRIDEAYRYLVQSYLNARNYRLALESLDKSNLSSVDLQKAYQRIAFYRGVELFNNLDFQQALANFDKSLKYASNDQTLKAKAIYWKGESYYRLENYTQAVSSFIEFKSASVAFTASEFAQVDYNLGYAWFKQKNYAKAVEVFQKFTANAPAKLNKEKVDALNRIGDCFYAQSNYTAAIDYYGRAMSGEGVGKEYASLQKGICQGLVNNDQQKISTLQQLVSSYPQSIYADEAFYEMAQSNMKLQNNNAAIQNLKSLISNFPNSKRTANGYVQLGLLYYNADNSAEAIRYYKETVTRYPGSPEAKDALFGLKNIYVDLNNVDAYFSFVNQLGSSAPVGSGNEQDSLNYIAAEKIYMSGNCASAITALTKYISAFTNGDFALNAHFYKGDCNYQRKEFNEALKSFDYVLSQPENVFTEQALLGSARIEYETKNYPKAIKYYNKLIVEYSNPGNTKEARIAIMKCEFIQNHYDEALIASRNVLSLSKLSPETEREATYIAARSLQETGRDALSIAEYRKLSTEVMSAEGAEAKFRLAELLVKQKEYNEAEKVVLDFSEKTTSHDYWIARSFILWADIFVEKQDYFQGIQTLNSIIDYYEKPGDGILEMAKKKKEEIVKLQEANEKPKEVKAMEVEVE